MIDIDAEFRRALGVSANTASVEVADEALTMEKLRELSRSLGPPPEPPITLRFSKHAPALGAITPKSTPLTDDMRAMCDDIGPQSVPIAYVFDTPFGRMAVANPVHKREGRDDGKAI